MGDVEESIVPIKCPYCGSTNWRCWDERSAYCWDSAGNYCADYVIGCLRCEDCKHLFQHVSVDGNSADCQCEDCDCS